MRDNQQIEKIKKEVKAGRKLHFGNNFIKKCPNCNGSGILPATVDDATDIEYRSQFLYEESNKGLK